MTSWIMIAALCAQGCALSQSEWPDEHSCANAAVVWKDQFNPPGDGIPYRPADARVVCVPKHYTEVKR